MKLSEKEQGPLKNCTIWLLLQIQERVPSQFFCFCSARLCQQALQPNYMIPGEWKEHRPSPFYKIQCQLGVTKRLVQGYTSNRTHQINSGCPDSKAWVFIHFAMFSQFSVGHLQYWQLPETQEKANSTTTSLVSRKFLFWNELNHGVKELKPIFPLERKMASARTH